jgi:cold shock CspA family protein
MNILAGTVKTYNPDKGFGFVTLRDLSGDIFFHISNVKNIESQLGTSSLELWFEMSTNNRGSYVNKAWASRDKIPEEYLQILEKIEANKRASVAKRELEINGTQEEHKAREELISKVTYLNFCSVLQPEEEDIRSLSVTPKLYKILQEHMWSYGLKTTEFYGRRVERHYTHNYCLENKSLLKLGGRPFSRSVDKKRYSNKTVKACTPSFEDMCRGVLRDYRSDVLSINR